jgi:NADH-quinone oxidoreductase subunit G
MSDDQVTLTIDGKSVTVPKGTMVVEAAKQADVEIPVFCYHEKLGPFGCCRMCLVEVEKMPRLTAACTQAVAQDMAVKTDTAKVKKARQGVLEFTLLNHPLDCPVCDKGGECPLQNNTFKYGPGQTRMQYEREHNDKAMPLSPVITIDRERCIACQRCTRYSDIIEQESALVMLNRGFHNEVGTFYGKPYDTRFSGNVVDICPVGALTNTDYRFKSRHWDLTSTETLCAHCGCNCNIVLGARQNRFMRVQARCNENSVANDGVDDGWICDKGRFGYGFVDSPARITTAQRVEGGRPAPVPVLEAAREVAEQLKKIVAEHGPKSVGFIGSPYGSNEELYLYQKLFRLGLGSNNIDHKTYGETPGLPVEHFDIADIETSGLVLLVASDPTEELPIIDLRIKKAVTRLGVKLAVLNDQSTEVDRFAAFRVQYKIGSDAAVLQALGETLAGNRADAGLQQSAGVAPEDLGKLADMIRAARKLCVIYNPAALSGGAIGRLKQVLARMKDLPDLRVGAIPSAPGTNAVGALDMGVLPEYYPGGIAVTDTAKVREMWGEKAPVEPGLNALEMIRKAASGEIKALVVFRANPVTDFPGGVVVDEALKKLEFLVIHDMMETETTRLADYILPSNGPARDEGTTTNIGGRVQRRRRGLTTETPSDCKIIAAMAQVLGDATVYRDAFAVTDEIAKKVPGYAEINKKSLGEFGKVRQAPVFRDEGAVTAPASTNSDGLALRVAHYLFARDKIIPADSALKHHFKPSAVHLHEEDARRLALMPGDRVRVCAGESEVTADVVVGNRCRPGGVLMPRIADDQGLSRLLSGDGAIARVTIRK